MSIGTIFSASSITAKCSPEKEKNIFRDKFERDRYRILYSKEFRRLNRKTQVFISGFDDHVRNRLTHTIEVAQISQTICDRLGINSTLSTAIAYGHDVGHTPFGHVGERVLNYFMNGCFGSGNKVDLDKRGFKHNWQGVRVVTDLEKISDDNIPGLNLTDYTLWGILNHTKVNPKKCEYKNVDQGELCHFNRKEEPSKCEKCSLCFTYYKKYEDYFDQETSWTVEGLVVRMADEIAQRHHDLEDGLFAGIIDQKEIIGKLKELFETYLSVGEIKKLDELLDVENSNIFIHTLSYLLVNFLVSQLLKDTKTSLEKLQKDFLLLTSDDFNNNKRNIFKIGTIEDGVFNSQIFSLVSYNSEFTEKEKRLQTFLRNRILNSHIAQRMDGKSTYILNQLINAYLENPQQLPDNTIYLLYVRWKGNELLNEYKEYTFQRMVGHLRENLKKDYLDTQNNEFRNALMRTICDLIAGMTDDFAIEQYDKLYGTTNVFSNY